MTNVITSKIGAASLHGIIKVEFALEMSQEDFTSKFTEFMSSHIDLAITNDNGEVVELETFGFSIETLVSYGEDEC